MEVLDLMDAVQHELEHVRKLATASPEKRFDKLYKLVCKMSTLSQAWQDIYGNKGSRTAGVDGETRADINPLTLVNLREALQKGTYQPKPLRRVYIPKKNGKLRPLGIPTLQDRIVQRAVAMVLESIYEPAFLPCSHGFRPKRSTISALRTVAYAYKAGTTWIVEGDIKSCFDAIPHRVILETLRKRIRDERFLALIASFLRVGVMEEGQFRNTYSGTPQGGIVSPLLANVVLHEFDVWMTQRWAANPPQESNAAYRQRQTKEYRQQTRRIKYLREMLKRGEPFPKGRKADEVKAELKRLEQARRHTRPSQSPRSIRYVRYADDFLVMLSAATRSEAEQLKAEMATWLQETLGLTLSEEKTLVTHVSDKLRFLGYDVQGIRNPNGTYWARLSIPVEKEREVTAKLQQATRYRPAPELDVFMNVNAIARGWTEYFRYAYDASHTFGRLTGVVFWLTANYLARKHNLSVGQVAKRYYWRDPRTGRKALAILDPRGKQLFIWNKYPQRQSILVPGGTVQDRPPHIITSWADGHSIERKAQLVAAANGRCEGCGAENIPLIAHHPKRLRSMGRGTKPRAASGYEQNAKLLCDVCHQAHHHGSTARK